MMFGRKEKPAKLAYDSSTQKPVLKCSICTGEQVAGLKDLRSGKFQEVMLIQNDKDLETFRSLCGVHEIPKEY